MWSQNGGRSHSLRYDDADPKHIWYMDDGTKINQNAQFTFTIKMPDLSEETCLLGGSSYSSFFVNQQSSLSGFTIDTFTQAHQDAFRSTFAKDTDVSVDVVSLAGIGAMTQSLSARRLAAGVVFKTITSLPDGNAASQFKTKAGNLDMEKLTNDLKLALSQKDLPVPADMGVTMSSPSISEPEMTTTSTTYSPGTTPQVVDVCFPGFATVDVAGLGHVALVDLRDNDRIRSKKGYEPFLGFLHVLRDGAAVGRPSYMRVVHEGGELVLSPGHLVFTADGDDRLASTVRAGDKLSTTHGSSTVLSINVHSAGTDAYAPLTASGTLFVDGVLSSSYASPGSAPFQLRHAVAHAVLFPVRAFHATGLCALLAQVWSSGEGAGDELHPYLDVVYQKLGFASLYTILSV